MPMRGHKSHLARLRYLAGGEPPKLVGQALVTGGDLIRTEAQLSITTGAVSGRGHVPSRPGEPPNADSHVLANNIETVQTGPLKVEVSSNAPHARIEWDWGNVRARPYMRPARDKMKGEVVKLVEKALARAVRQSRSTRKD